MTDDDATILMAKFGKAFFKKDPAALAQVVTADVEWHFAIGNDNPNGRVHHGVDGFIRGVAENEALFERLRFNDVVCRSVGDDTIVMTYRLDGKHRDGDSFDLRGIELITVVDGKLAKKDVFWKQTPT
jgi:ketosteroid isomerase-like protein